MEWWKILNKEVEPPKELTKNKLNNLYNEYFEKIANQKSIYMLSKHIKLQKEYFIIELLEEINNSLHRIISIYDIKEQELVKIEIVNIIKKMFTRANISLQSTIVEIINCVIQLTNEQHAKIINIQSENKENEKTSIYKIIASISLSLNMKLNPHELTVSEFIEYYKIAEENGKQ